MSTPQLEQSHHWCFGENSELLFHPDKNQAQVHTWHFTSTNEIPVCVLIVRSAIRLLPCKTYCKIAV